MRLGQLQAMRVYNGDDDIRMTDIATVTGIQECLRKVSNNPFDQGCGRQLELGETNVAEIVRPANLPYSIEPCRKRSDRAASTSSQWPQSTIYILSGFVSGRHRWPALFSGNMIEERRDGAKEQRKRSGEGAGCEHQARCIDNCFIKK
ncbi:uncharacterized protein L203_102357 [Cryptococcus depauperatus CBS 7841]|uniref:Uncharacterized protein n=1 Tax=Cryptococcus depauperatus CBS 7841 TaxID=1295531 RepID=A0AAJ8M094_9TREE